MTVRRIGLRVVIIAAVVLIVGIAAAALAMRNPWSGRTGGPLQAVYAPADVVARGKYLSEAADCASWRMPPALVAWMSLARVVSSVARRCGVHASSA